jgi:pyruvyltransferase
MTVLLKQYAEHPNAGDVASKIVVEFVTGGEAVTTGEQACDMPNLIAIGSILHWADSNSRLWGCGLIGADVRLAHAPHRIIAVRGPLTRQRLQQDGLAVPDLIGDPGIFAADVFPRAAILHDIGLVPHYVDRDHPYVHAAAERGIHVINCFDPLPIYLRELSSCRRIISSSLHGIVFAHSYGIPAVWVELSEKVHGAGFKFLDYYSSIGIDATHVSRLRSDISAETAADRCSLPKRSIDKDGLRVGLLKELPELSGNRPHASNLTGHNALESVRRHSR